MNQPIVTYRIASSALTAPMSATERQRAEDCFLHYAQFSHATLMGLLWCGTWIVLADSWKPKRH